MNDTQPSRVKIKISGAVQGVGFRPFVYRLACDLALTGWVRNTAEGVEIEAQAPQAVLGTFEERLRKEPPPHARILSLASEAIEPLRGEAGEDAKDFRILESGQGPRRALILPDLATCEACRREIFDLVNRRYLYPFTNCTHCGPRFSIIEALPYDRPNTSMRRFEMCERCRAEYENPADRRFHAQPVACPDCGPHLEFWSAQGRVLGRRGEALAMAADALREGQTLALKGLGGFQLVARADCEQAAGRLRQAKHRREKPFAVMVPTLADAQAICEVGDPESALLQSAEAPIVLLRRISPSPGQALAGSIADSVAPGNPWLGVMLPTTPLHHILLARLGLPIIATSGNRRDEPICIDEHEALERLGGLADAFLVHDRPIVRHLDDSVARIVDGQPMLLRRARGYAPLPVEIADCGQTFVSVGGHLKNTAALHDAGKVFASQHIGDLETPQALDAHSRVLEDLARMYELTPRHVACDAHPDYASTAKARAMGLPVTVVQHHYAHALACLADNRAETPALAVTWDGTGYGDDGTVWGGEFLLIEGVDSRSEGYRRVAHLRSFRLPGAEAAVREPRRSALGVLWDAYGEEALAMGDLPTIRSFSAAELKTLGRMLGRGLNAPVTTSAGRLFDAASSLAGLRQSATEEGLAAMALEFSIDAAPEADGEPYPFSVARPHAGDESDTGDAAPLILDWRPMVAAMVADVRRGEPTGLIARRFHDALIGMIVTVAEAVRDVDHIKTIALTGGCFQNIYLLEGAIGQLRRRGFTPLWHHEVPPGDGGIAVGQAVALARILSREDFSCV